MKSVFFSLGTLCIALSGLSFALDDSFVFAESIRGKECKLFSNGENIPSSTSVTCEYDSETGNSSCPPHVQYKKRIYTCEIVPSGQRCAAFCHTTGKVSSYARYNVTQTWNIWGQVWAASDIAMEVLCADSTIFMSGSAGLPPIPGNPLTVGTVILKAIGVGSPVTLALDIACVAHYVGSQITKIVKPNLCGYMVCTRSEEIEIPNGEKIDGCILL